ncbi:MAG: hypothetical protein M3R11_05060 [Acidobacteriota bacterium]|nr:hypothetical protein [Acidobacteriota bacterium]
MITGFNTDIDYEGITYHVQTEDKGLATPMILSLVYDRGTILASKRSPYDDLLDGEFDEKVLIERLQKQHKLICAAVRAGRIEDLKRMTMKESASRQKGLVAQKEFKSVVEKKEEIADSAEVKTEEIPEPAILKRKTESFEQLETKNITSTEAVWDVPLQIVEDSIVEIVEELILPAEAVEIITDSANAETISDDKLKIELLSETKFKGGERKTISMMVRRGNQKAGLSGVQILVKIIGSAFRPLIFHAKTDSNGVATAHLQLPHFKTGRAAVLIKAMSEGEETELRRTIQ